MNHPRGSRALLAAAVLAYLIAACAVQDMGTGDVHRWWSGFGPVLPHDSFPADCQLCHVGAKWDEIRADFEFDHAGETGYALVGAHARAVCLRCHNDRGPVDTFAAQGCAGCHEDFHRGTLGQDCLACHTQDNWRPVGMVEMHSRTRFPLLGAHLPVACHRCHPGAFVGNFAPVDTSCVTCHANDVAGTTNPPHIPLGWTDNCQRCHFPTTWNQARQR